MSELPKLKFELPFGWPRREEICELEQAKETIFGYGTQVFVFVEGQWINSYEKLVQLVTQDRYKDKEFLEVVMYPFMGGG